MARMHRFRLTASSAVINGHRHTRGAVITLPDGAPAIRELKASGRWEHTSYTVADIPPAPTPAPGDVSAASGHYARLVNLLRPAADFVDGLSERERQGLGEFMVAQGRGFLRYFERIMAPGQLASPEARARAIRELEEEPPTDRTPEREPGESAADRQPDGVADPADEDLARGALAAARAEADGQRRGNQPAGLVEALPTPGELAAAAGGEPTGVGTVGRPPAATMESVDHDRTTPEAREIALGVLKAALDKPGQRSKAKILDLAQRAGVPVNTADAALERAALIAALRSQLGMGERAPGRAPAPEDLGD